MHGPIQRGANCSRAREHSQAPPAPPGRVHCGTAGNPINAPNISAEHTSTEHQANRQTNYSRAYWCTVGGTNDSAPYRTSKCATKQGPVHGADEAPDGSAFGL